MPAVDAVMTGSQGVPAGFACELDTGETKQRRPLCQKSAARFLEDPVSRMKEQKEQLGLRGEVEAKVQALDKLRLKNGDCSCLTWASKAIQGSELSDQVTGHSLGWARVAKHSSQE